MISLKMFKFCFFCCLTFGVVKVKSIEKNDKYVYPDEMFMKQNLDHFDPTDDRLYNQRYFVSEQYWDSNKGPVFFYAGNEGDIEVFINNTGFIWDIAPLFRAKVIFAEHRYFGKSLPFGDITPSVKTKKQFSKLTVEQAMADYAVLLTQVIKQAENSGRSRPLPIIAFGGSYGGMLSAWLRVKYPHIVTGAVASSAPIDYFYNRVKCSEYNQVVTEDFLDVPKSGRYCASNILKSWPLLMKFDKIGEGMAKLSAFFKTCTTLKSATELISWIVETLGELAMVNYPYPTNFLADLPAWPLNKTCDAVGDGDLDGLDLLNGMLNAVSVFHNSSGAADCFNVGQVSTKITGVLWDFMTCTEMVMPFCSNGVTDMFPVEQWSLESFEKGCQKRYGTKPRPFWANINFGGKNLDYASNILFINGKLDPWHVGSPLESISDQVQVINMWGAAHHLDLRHVNLKNPASVKQAHKKEVELIQKWIESI